MDDRREGRNYHLVEMDGSDPRGAEALIDIGKEGIAVVPFYHLADGSNPPYGRRIEGSIPQVWLRAGLIPMLRSANAALADHGCELVVYDGYRPVSVQRGLWAWALAKVRADHPHLPEAELEAVTRRYSSDPRRFDPEDFTTWPTHSTGGAVDVMLRSCATGEVLDMGTAFDDLSPAAHTDALEQALRRGEIGPDDAALQHRRLLYWAMTDAGFANYPLEYWHFDFGTQMYVVNGRTVAGMPDRAWYGYCPPPT